MVSGDQTGAASALELFSTTGYTDNSLVATLALDLGISPITGVAIDEDILWVVGAGYGEDSGKLVSFSLQ